MKNVYWFSDYDDDLVLDETFGTEKKAIERAKMWADAWGEDIIVNCGENIIKVVVASEKSKIRRIMEKRKKNKQ